MLVGINRAAAWGWSDNAVGRLAYGGLIGLILGSVVLYIYFRRMFDKAQKESMSQREKKETTPGGGSLGDTWRFKS
jgi:hypothetical protein